jgi:hypothetical protein
VVAQALRLEIDVHSNNLTTARRSVTECAPIVPQVFARAGKKKGRPLRAALPLSSRDPAKLSWNRHFQAIWTPIEARIQLTDPAIAERTVVQVLPIVLASVHRDAGGVSQRLK